VTNFVMLSRPTPFEAIPVPCSVPDGPARFLLSSRCQLRLPPGSCLAVHFALRLAQTNVPPGFTLMRDVRDAPALPNELRAAMVTWLPEMSALSSRTSPVIAGLSRLPPLETTNRSTARPSRQVLLGRARYAGSQTTFLPKLTVLRRRTLLLVSDRPAG